MQQVGNASYTLFGSSGSRHRMATCLRAWLRSGLRIKLLKFGGNSWSRHHCSLVAASGV